MPSAPSRLRATSPAILLGSLVLMLFISPFVENVQGGDLVEAVLLSIVLFASALAASDRRSTLIWGAVLVIPALVGKWANHFLPDAAPAEIFLVSGLLFVAFVTVQLLRYIARAPRVDTQVLCAGVSTYLMLGLLWAFAFILLDRIVPGSFAFTLSSQAGRELKGFAAIYFSFITLCTVGYGDIVPVSGPARMLAMMEGMTGVLYIAVLVARLVSLYPASNQSRPTDP